MRDKFFPRASRTRVGDGVTSGTASTASTSEAPELPGSADDAATDPRIAVLLGSPLFDPAWYAATAGCREAPVAAAGHYLRRGRARGHWPHPLFVPALVARGAKLPEQAGGGAGPDTDPLVHYLQTRAFDLVTHPLFDVAAYVRDHPEAAEHEHGPLGHYVQIGAPAGLAPNSWFRPDPAEPGGLVAWVADRHAAWHERQRSAPRARSRPHVPVLDPAAAGPHVPVLDPAAAGPDGPDGSDVSPVSVVLHGLDHTETEDVLVSVRSLRDQDHPDWELLVVLPGTVRGTLLEEVAAELPGTTVRAIRAGGEHPAVGLDAALAEATGDHVAWLVPGETWRPARLRMLLAAGRAAGTALAYDSLVVRRETKADVFLGGVLPAPSPPRSLASVDLSRLLARVDVVRSAGGFDATMAGAWTVELSFRLLARHPATPVPVVGVVRDDTVARRAAQRAQPDRSFPDHPAIGTWVDVAFNRHAVDWAALEHRPPAPGVVTVVVPTFDDHRMTSHCVRALAAAEVPDGTTLECLVWDNGSDAVTAQVLDSLTERYAGVRVLHTPTNLGFALGNNLAVAEARGDTVVFLNNDTRVDPGWLAPLLEPLADPEVLGVQSLLLYPSGTVQSAGVAFPSVGGLPYPFLQHFPVEDARHAGGLELSAVTGAALALRFRDVVALRGFDPLFRNGMEDVDLCLRLSRLRGGGSFRVAPASRVLHHESRTPGRLDRAVVNRQLFLDRWRTATPRDDEALWHSVGFDVLDHVPRSEVSSDRRACVPEPVLRRSRAQVVQHPPRLRWALKIAPPPGPLAESWGDTHFARRLGVALRRLGQEVVVDRREEYDRRTGHHDDVVLTLRGLYPHNPQFGQVSLAWVISHPELVTAREAASYDRVLAASHSWSRQMSQRWRLPIEPLLQATDPDLFCPERAQTDAGHAVLFVGGSRHHYRRIVRDSVEIGLPLSVYGSGWEEFIPRDYIKGEHVPHGEVGALYASAGVVLNDHWDDMREHGFLSNRLFDAAASGARVVTDDVQGLDGIFGASVQVAQDAQQLSRLVGGDQLDRLFGTAAERAQVAARVHRDHSFQMRAHRLLDIALEVRHEQRLSHVHTP